MTYRRILISFFCCLAVSPFGLGQNATAAAAAQNIYRNFLGNWEGSSEHMVNGQLVREAVEVVITEVPRKHIMRLNYVYDAKGKPVKRRRFLELDPTKESMKTQDKGFSADKYEVRGLKQFAELGLGDFSASRPSSTPINDTHRGKERTRVTFHLGVDTLNYEWASASDGQTYETYSRFSFRRRN